MKNKNPFLNLNRETKLASLQHMLSDFHQGSKVFVLKGSYYTDPLENSDLSSALKQMCMWLGVKPHNLVVKFSSLPHTPYQYTHIGTAHTIIIDHYYSDKPRQAISLLAKAATEYYLERKNYLLRQHTDRHEYVELATLHLGFGVAIVNGTYRSKIVEVLKGTYNRHNNPALHSMSVKEYVELFCHFAANLKQEYFHYVVPRMKHLISQSANPSFVLNTVSAGD